MRSRWPTLFVAIPKRAKMGPDREIQPADPVARARLLRRLLLPAILGLLLAAVLSTASRHWVPIAPVQWVYGLMALLLLIGILMMWPLRSLWRSGRRAIEARRFPPPGEPVIRDTPVYRGEEALLRGRMLQALAAVLAAFVLATPAAIGWMLYLVLA